jgi:ubiquinone/menaquinone biosynthesis C-methylase UbiE
MQPKPQQNLVSKRGEVAFRRKIAAQQSGEGEAFFEEAHTKPEILAVMGERISQTRGDMQALTKMGASLTPYIELGAERGQRALVLENEFGVKGFALDISFEMLRYASLVAEHFDYTRMPVRIACDAYNLPFQNSVIEFAFCYQTLHHFPTPQPICEELLRIQKANGILFFDDEPVKGYITKFTRLYHRRGHRLGAFEKILSRAGLLAMLSKADDLEKEHNILEEEFDIPTWRRALCDFHPLEVIVNRKLRIRLNSLNWSWRARFAQLMGGNIRVVCQATKPGVANQFSGELLDLLGCPNCKDKPRLSRLPSSGLKCLQCGSIYPQIVWSMADV